MAILNFPNTGLVANVTQYTGDNGTTYTWDGVKWVGRSAGGAAGTNSIQNGSFTVQVAGDGSLIYPNVALQRDTATVQCLGNASTVVYTVSAQYQHTIRLLIQVEGFPGSPIGYDTQACEMIIAKSFRANDIAAAVYGIVHTSAEPLATFTAEWNTLTNRVDVVCTTPGANDVYVRTFATEITTSD
jgi:hypothetical protein